MRALCLLSSLFVGRVINISGVVPLPSNPTAAAAAILDVLDRSLRLMQAMAKSAKEDFPTCSASQLCHCLQFDAFRVKSPLKSHAQDGPDGMPELWLPICLSNAVVDGDLAASSAKLPASHAGIWGLAKARLISSRNRSEFLLVRT